MCLRVHVDLIQPLAATRNNKRCSRSWTSHTRRQRRGRRHGRRRSCTGSRSCRPPDWSCTPSAGRTHTCPSPAPSRPSSARSCCYGSPTNPSLERSGPCSLHADTHPQRNSHSRVLIKFHQNNQKVIYFWRFDLYQRPSSEEVGTRLGVFRFLAREIRVEPRKRSYVRLSW